MSRPRTIRAVLIRAPHFQAAVVPGIFAAPILGYMVKWSEERILTYCRSKRWATRIFETEYLDP